MPRVRLRVNGSDRDADVPSGMPLLWALRDRLGLTGTKYGCGVSECGACTVLVDGVPARSCAMTAESAAGRALVTIEGLSADRSHVVQRAWIEEDVPQCGYCQSGQILAATALLASDPNPDDAAIDAAMNGHLCRCGTYPRIRSAVKRAAAMLREEAR